MISAGRDREEKVRKAMGCRTLLFGGTDGTLDRERVGGERGAAPAAEPPMRTKSA